MSERASRYYVEPAAIVRGTPPDSWRAMQAVVEATLARSATPPPSADVEPGATSGPRHDPMQGDSVLADCGTIHAGRLDLRVVVVARGGGHQGRAVRVQVAGPATRTAFGVRLLAGDADRLIAALQAARAQLGGTP